MENVEETSFDVFLSHAHVDAPVVEMIGAKLEDQAKLRVWLDRWILVPGERWQQEMARGLDQAKTCAVCIGTDTPNGWFREEIERALNRQTKEDAFRVIPVILPGGDPTLVDDFLELRTWVEFADGLHDVRAFHVFVSGIKGVAPGRMDQDDNDPPAGFAVVREKLSTIRELRRAQLIDDDIALEYQRRLIDTLIEAD